MAKFHLRNLARFFNIIMLLYKNEFASFAELLIHCPGTPGHGSLLHENTAVEKVNYIMNKFLALREEEKAKLKANKNLTIGDVTTINVTMLKVRSLF